MVLTTPLLGSLPLSFKRLHKNGMIHSYPWRVTWRNLLSSLLSNLQSNLLMTHLSDKASQHLGLTSQTLHSRAQLTGTLQDGASFTNYRIRLANAVPSGPCPSLKGRICFCQHRICFHCLATTNHLAKDCATQVKCSECHSDKHVTALHAGPPSKPAAEEVELKDAHQYGGEPAVTSSCTKVCGNTMGGKSCAKICLVSIYANSQPENKIKAYVVIDDQSNCSLAKPKLFDLLNLGGKATPYMLKMCSGTSQAMGRRAHNLVIESFDGTQSHTLPILTECNAIPDRRNSNSCSGQSPPPSGSYC